MSGDTQIERTLECTPEPIPSPPPKNTTEVSRPNMEFVEGTRPQFSDETAGLLRGRLQAASLVLPILLAVAFVLNFWSEYAPLAGIRALILAGFVASYFVLRGPRRLSLRQLRWFEAGAFGAVLIQMLLMSRTSSGQLRHPHADAVRRRRRGRLQHSRDHFDSPRSLQGKAIGSVRIEHQARRGRHGRGVPGGTPVAQAPLRDQADQARQGRQRRVARPFRARSPGNGKAHPLEHGGYQNMESLDKALGECACDGKWTEEQAAAWWQRMGVDSGERRGSQG